MVYFHFLELGYLTNQDMSQGCPNSVVLVYSIHVLMLSLSISVKRELSDERGDGGSGDHIPVTSREE